MKAIENSKNDEAVAYGSDHVGGDCRGENFFTIDPSFQALLKLYLSEDEQKHFWPHFERLGDLAGGTLDECADLCDKHPPVLHDRDRFGRDRQWIEYHPAYREMERIGFYQYGLHAAPHRPILGWPTPVSPLVKFGLHYIFSQAEFGLMCPIGVTELAAMLVFRYGSPQLIEQYGNKMVSLDPKELLQGAQFMTEKAGGSDVGANELMARFDGSDWRLHGEKWFCSNPDCGAAVLLARVEGDPDGTKGLTAFLVPKDLPDGSRNDYRIARLKNKMGSKSLASGEIIYEGAVAYMLGKQGQGIKILLDQVNLSRLSHGVRAAATMRRALNESLAFAGSRRLFGKPALDQPLMRRQLVQLLVWTEQALSTSFYGGDVLQREEQGCEKAKLITRIITPTIKMRSNRDNVKAATKALEIRGGNGVIEDWTNSRLLRDSFVPVNWEGTSVINAIDALRRAVGKCGAHLALRDELHRLTAEATLVSQDYRDRLDTLSDQAIDFAAKVAGSDVGEALYRQATSMLYHALSATLLAWEADRSARDGSDARRLLISRMVVDHRLDPAPVMAQDAAATWEDEAIDILLSRQPMSMEEANALISR
ncbi:Putative acyl-CoA dehydrogenase AidB [Marinovum algicola]|uniref:Acyl-CoA dehydrogenase n=1 Tax=Marinovum algicola TaxID=42444 RepID=A0A975ZQT4_9RHOB|nr:acyl-CoA dehydrogenase family protein [Marinovum algicola]SEK09035.1 Acyl-CoA dehydrogenase [Marinovum algicola]SLN71775.1 Putative acyl-CoA dehydrogenase AidB [Marinovum algicola]